MDHKTILGLKKFGSKLILGLKSLVKIGSEQLGYCFHGKMSSGQILSGDMSPVKDGSRNLPLKFGQNWFSNSNIADMDKCCLDKSHQDS